ncbi:MAG TPA: DinB family protein [Vicinamibacterales bacterium]|nr:DinB family protein [Vicinamibacterales bacterium]
MDAAAHYLEDAIVQAAKIKALAEGAIAQLTDEELFQTIDPESNSVALVMRHVAGNLRSRFTDFLTTDGEKPDRQRDGEFEMPSGTSRASVVAAWDAGFTCLDGALRQLTPADLLREVTIRGGRHTVIQALQRALTHVAYHVGQIVLLAKHLRGSNWKTLSIPRGQSEDFKGPRRF